MTGDEEETSASQSGFGQSEVTEPVSSDDPITLLRVREREAKGNQAG